MGKDVVAQIVLNVTASVEDQSARIGAHDALNHRRHADENTVMGNVAQGPTVLDDPHGFPYPPRDPHDQRRRAE